MNFDGNAPQYSAFAIVAIESVWPNPDGNEIPPDTYDMDLLRNAESTDADSEGYASQIGQGSYERPTFQMQSVDDEQSYQKKEGYYKILPLNVIKVDTRATKEGSEFSLSFTLDDLLLVTDSDTDVLNATGLPIQARDLVHLGDKNSLPTLFRDEDRSGWEYKQDSELGLSRYKINGASSSFNIEDLVTSNDTVTIWIYHDPSDFYLKDKLPELVDDNTLTVNDDIKNVIGSGDRRNQFSDDTTSFEEYVLGSLGLINKYIGETITSTLLEEDVDDVNISTEELLDVIRSFVEEGVSGNLDDEEQLFEFAGNFLNVGEKGVRVPQGRFPNVFDSLILPYLVPNRNQAEDYLRSAYEPGTGQESFSANETGSLWTETPEAGRLREVLTRLRNTFDDIIRGFDYDKETGMFVVPEDSRELGRLVRTIPYFSTEALLEYGSYSDAIDAAVENIALAASFFKKTVEAKATKYQRDYLENKTTISSEQRFSHGRKVLINDFSGETPYLALKGKISNVSVAVGTGVGTHTVTLTGQGYEKTLNEHEIFYEDLLYPSASAGPQSEYMSSYGLMIPPRAMIDIVNRYAAKQVILGSPTDFTKAAMQSFFQFAIQLNENENEGENPEERVDMTFLKDGGPLRGQIPLRGNFALAEFTTQAELSDIRLFHPINYIDTTRLSEMVRTLERSYEIPQGEGVINTAVFMTTRTSVMQNLRAVGGMAEFYELFVDETGRLRYRLSFEAMERTPKPSITPTIQDENLLSGASFTRNDALVKTMVDVRPITGQHNFELLDLGFVGRSVAEQGVIPIKNATQKGGVDISESISPDLYRYGFRSLQIQDIYTSETQGAGRKANLYRMFYGKPLKQANVSVINNTSYRVGDTTLVALQRNKHRSRTLINLQKTKDWLEYISEYPELVDMYVGVDERLLMRDSYVPTAASYYPIPSDRLYEGFAQNPKAFVLQKFIDTFKYLIDIDGLPNVITPDYFPPTYWYFAEETDDYYHWDEGTLKSEDIVELYTNTLKAALSGSQNASNAISAMFNKYPGIIQALKFQDFRAASYYIESVTHKFAHGKDAVTQLALNHGQDNLVLLEPKRFLPIGFISIEKRMRIGYDSPEQQRLFFENEERSALQNIYIEQLREENEFRSASFMYRAQELRNSSNYMHSLARREGILADVDVEMSESISTPSTPSNTDTNADALAISAASDMSMEISEETMGRAADAVRQAGLTSDSEKIAFLYDYYNENQT